MNEAWLREDAYPLIKGAAEFYRHFPNFGNGEDGQYHLHHTNNSESSWNTSDTPYEVLSMRTIFPIAVRASEILGLDVEARAAWREIAEHLVPLPPGAGRRPGPYGAFVYEGEGAIPPQGPEAELKSRFLGFTRLGSFIDPEGIGGAQIFRNRLRLREGPGAVDAEHIGGLAAGLHATMLSNTSAGPGDEPVLRVFDGWPRDWDAAFALRAAGAFVVRAAQVRGRVAFVEVRSQAGGRYQMLNPWKGSEVAIARDGAPASVLSGDRLAFPTRKGETILLAPKGETTPALRIP
jgi:hypothetical protein